MSEEPSKPNCYDCTHRRNVPGDTHSACFHPLVSPKNNDPIDLLIETIAGKHKTAADALGIRAVKHGVAMGWFMWPANFDPTWLVSCKGFEKKAAQT